MLLFTVEFLNTLEKLYNKVGTGTCYTGKQISYVGSVLKINFKIDMSTIPTLHSFAACIGQTNIKDQIVLSTITKGTGV